MIVQLFSEIDKRYDKILKKIDYYWDKNFKRHVATNAYQLKVWIHEELNQAHKKVYALGASLNVPYLGEFYAHRKGENLDEALRSTIKTLKRMIKKQSS